MSMVPWEVVREIRETWPARDMPLYEYAIERTAEWALDLAAEACGQVAAAYNEQGAMHHVGGADACAEAIRALIKRGESDGK
jgi:hypothetical protein